MSNYFKFLYEKTRDYSLYLIVRLEFESLVFGLLSLAPTTFGVLIRGMVCKFFFKKIAGFAWIQPRCIIIHSDRLTVGTHFGMNSGSYLNAVGEIEIGNHVLIGSNVTISSGMHPIEGDVPIFSRRTVPKKITIGDDVWIGAGAVIMPGISVAKGTVIGANAVVTHDTEEFGVYVGVPAKKIKNRIVKIQI